MVLRFALAVRMILCASALAAAALVSACADGSNLPPPAFLGEPGQGIERTYRLGIGDKVKIGVFGEDNLSGDFVVTATGQIPMPLIGDVPAKGRSLSEFRRDLEQRLADGYLKNPKVSVEILNYRSIYVHGEVKNGGEFGYKAGLKFRDAVAMAGGYTYRAATDYLILMRDGQPDARVSLPSDLPVLPGDNIRVPERFF